MFSLKGARVPIDFILVSIHWYAAYLLSHRYIAEMMGGK
ncbi:Uncharacterised protein [Janthinobacterium lividum]|nr:hypothetical protein JANLI_53880 [Janthinobacterium lividum]STS86098.1 Uncharacterised protein [Janthinobacterium lividum]